MFLARSLEFSIAVVRILVESVLMCASCAAAALCYAATITAVCAVQGCFVGGQRDGLGQCVSADGSEYTGTWRGNKRNGTGVSMYVDACVSPPRIVECMCALQHCMRACACVCVCVCMRCPCVYVCAHACVFMCVYMRVCVLCLYTCALQCVAH